MRIITIAAAALAAGAVSRAQDLVEVGSTPKFEFKSPLINGRGLKSLADLQGRPTIIEFWGTR